jgi:hypothetical protein
MKYYRARGFNPKILRSDGDTVAENESMTDALVDFEMIHEHSAPYRQFQNGKVERNVQTVLKGVSLLLHSQDWLQADQWDTALFHFVECRNHTLNTNHKFKTPDHRINGRPLNLSRKFQFAFGDVVAVGIPDDLRTWKFDLRNDIGIYVGQPEGTVDTSFVYFPDSGATLERGSIRKLELNETKVLQYFQRRRLMRESSLKPRDFVEAMEQLLPPEQILYNFEQNDPVVSSEGGEPARLSQPLFESEPAIPKRRARRQRSKLVQSDMNLRTRALGALSASTAPTEPIGIHHDDTNTLSNVHHAVQAYAAKVTSKRALSGTDQELWLAAIRAEIIDNLFGGGTLVAEQPTGRYGIDYKVIMSTLQLKIKLRDDMTIEKYKARLCARGDMLRGLIDETYSPTISAMAHAVAHQLAIIDNMHTCSVDTVAAYLYEDYPSEAQPLYLKLEPHVAVALGLDPDTTYRIKKYLYGLPDSGRAYYRGYSTHLESNGYKRSISDPCLFVKLSNGDRTYVWIHVDDTFVASTNPAELLEFQRVVGLKYKFTVQADIESFLGVHMTKLADGKSVRLTQPKLLAEIFEEFHPELLSNTSRVKNPQSTILPDSDEWDSTPFSRHDYLHLLGALIYVTKSRPDIATAVSFAATHAVTPTVGAYQELLRCVQYLWNTQEAGLVLHTGNPGAELKLKCYVDASYLTHADSKSHTGYCLSFGEIGVFYAKSIKQALVTTSSTHAEMRALYQLILEIIYVVNLCEELGRPVSLPAIVMEDNQPVIDLSKDLTKRSKKCKHFLMLVNYVREQVQSGLIAISKVATEDNLADILTKILAGSEFIEKAEQLLGMQFSYHI